MIENIKTVVLWFLVLTSMTLTWFILSYQPEYDNLEDIDIDYVQSEEIGESRSINEVISPKEILIHNQEDISWIQPIEGHYPAFMEFLSELELEYFESGSSEDAPSLDQTLNGLELVFSEAIKHEWISDLFNVDENILPEELDQIDRVILLEDSSGEGSSVILQLISTELEVIYNFDIASLTIDQLEQMYEESEEYQIPVEKRILNDDSMDDAFQQVIYVPTQPFTLKEYTYETADLPIASFIQALFTDPEYVDRSPLGSQTDSYTDGNRMMEIQDSENLINYVRPGVVGSPISEEESLLETAVDFINGHDGWTDEYYIGELEQFMDSNEISFRLHVDGIPVFGSNRSAEYYTMRLARSGGQISEYDRPIFKLDSATFEDTVEMPSIHEVDHQLEEEEWYNLETVEDIRVGYYMTRHRSFVTFRPAWYVETQNGRWTRLDMNSEEMENGLE
ncbi:hypothetical protein CR203_17265 [Salipaludibacillus neizhouensis]|uniref:Regulatory protein YycH domain-containing protein n=1 Tax=Salipaludibacillus neizhouensis TaxID=885475 RepID=A0A3A9K8S1_9BACI|nr:two-component system activity regulator YycH [Salipaludibacillus neizhouensis]RKL66043.1 hypothetical protein CR203_17265 [Salipaludibacillus neizhouensis]